MANNNFSSRQIQQGFGGDLNCGARRSRRFNVALQINVEVG
jgi:hypothetical protein